MTLRVKKSQIWVAFTLPTSNFSYLDYVLITVRRKLRFYYYTSLTLCLNSIQHLWSSCVASHAMSKIHPDILGPTKQVHSNQLNDATNLILIWNNLFLTEWIKTDLKSNICVSKGLRYWSENLRHLALPFLGWP